MRNTENERRTEEALKLSSLFEELDGRRPRLFMPELEDDDDKEARKLAATTFADHGWDVDVSPLLSPESSAQNAADNDVHFIFYTSKSPTMKQKLIALSQTLAMSGRDDILIAAHQVSKDDKELLFRYGILAAFDKNTDVSDVSLTMLRVLVSMAKEEQNPTEEMPYCSSVPYKQEKHPPVFYYGQTAYGLPKENAGHCKKYFRNTFIYSSAYFKHCYPVSVQTCKNDLIPQLRVLVRHPEQPQYHLSMQLLY